MKAALCFSGEPRYIKQTYDNWLNNFILPNNITDIFCHFYLDETNVNIPFKITDNKQPEVFIDNDIEEFIYSKFSPKSFIKDNKKNIITEPVQYELSHHPNCRKMFYSIWKCNELKKEYELKNNFIYDYVIRARTDLNMTQKIILNELQFNKYPKLRLNDFNIFVRYSDIPEQINDWFAIGNSKNMNIYSNLWIHLNEFIKNHGINPTDILYHYIINYNNLYIVNDFKFLHIFNR